MIEGKRVENTKNYEIFKLLKGNAPINILHLNLLIEAIQKKNLLASRPILVNEKMEVIDGQHRLESAKRLNLPIYYITTNDLNITDISTLNSNQRNWKMEHYLELYSEHMKNENYIKFKNWMIENKFTFGQAIGFFMEEISINDFRHKFKNGAFEFIEEKINLAENFHVFKMKCEAYMKGPSRYWSSQSCVRAFSMLCKNPDVEFVRFCTQLDKYPFLLTPQPSKQQFLEMFYEIYNHRRHIRVDN
jgi:hypothetical protein